MSAQKMLKLFWVNYKSKMRILPKLFFLILSSMKVVLLLYKFSTSNKYVSKMYTKATAIRTEL